MDTRKVKTMAIVNPASAAGRTKQCWERIQQALHKSLGVCDAVFTEYPGHATSLARDALQNGYSMVVAVGGDGTFGEVAGGFFEGKTALFPHACLGLIPQGTGSDFGRTLGMDNNWAQACERLADDSYKTIDVGHVTFVDHQGNDAQRVFINVASFGCGGAVAKAVKLSNKKLGPRLSFALATFKTLIKYQDQAVEVTADGQETQTLAITNYAVCNAKYFGGGMQVAPSAKIDDGRLETTIWSGFDLKDFIFLQHQLYKGSHIKNKRTQTGSTRHLFATSDDIVLLDVDGENPGRLPATFSIIPQSLKLKV